MSGELSTHVISKLGKPSVAGAKVVLRYAADATASPFEAAQWIVLQETALSEHGGCDTLVNAGDLKLGLYAVEYDFGGVDAHARNLYKKEGDDKFVALNPGGFFLAAKTVFTVKVEDVNSQVHLVVSIGDKEVTVRPGVRMH